LKLNSIEIIYCFKVYVIYLAEKNIAVLTDVKRVILDKFQAYHNNSWGQWSLLFVWSFYFLCFNATFNNISAISWRPVLVVGEAEYPEIATHHGQAVNLITCGCESSRGTLLFVNYMFLLSKPLWKDSLNCYG
jgi:hypothetical protein